jgi:hypothetical protein
VGEELSCDVDEWSVARQLDLSSLLVELVGCNTKYEQVSAEKNRKRKESR